MYNYNFYFYNLNVREMYYYLDDTETNVDLLISQLILMMISLEY